jgi:O-antigen ligase
MLQAATQRSVTSVGYIILIAFVLFRPISLVFGGPEFNNISVIELFTVSISYFLIIPILINIRRLELDLILLLVLTYCFFINCSIFWGSEVRDVARLTIPFILFIGVRSIIQNTKQINLLITIFAVGYIVLLMVSAILILKGESIAKIEFYSEVERYRGAFFRIHVFAYSALLFSFLYAFIIKNFTIQNVLTLWILRFSLLASIFCLYNTHTRTAMFGFILFWIIYFLGQKKRNFVIFLLMLISVFYLYQDKVEVILWKTPEQRDLNRATSGRISLWQKNLSNFSNYSVEQKLFGGNPIGNNQNTTTYKKELKVHSDYLALLLKTGIMGLLLYLAIYVALLKDIYKSRLAKDKKYVFYGVAIAVMLMNFVSNAYVHRPELSQFFWFIMGLFYSLNKIRNIEYENKPN